MDDLYKIGVQHAKKSLAGQPVKYTPEELLDKFDEFLDWASNNSVYKSDVIRSGVNAGNELKIKCERALILEDWFTYAGIVKSTWSNYKNKKSKLDDDSPQEMIDEANKYLNVTTLISTICYAQKKQGALNGIYNPNIVAFEMAKYENPENQEKGSMVLTQFIQSTQVDKAE